MVFTSCAPPSARRNARAPFRKAVSTLRAPTDVPTSRLTLPELPGVRPWRMSRATASVRSRGFFGHRPLGSLSPYLHGGLGFLVRAALADFFDALPPVRLGVRREPFPAGASTFRCRREEAFRGMAPPGAFPARPPGNAFSRPFGVAAGAVWSLSGTYFHPRIISLASIRKRSGPSLPCHPPLSIPPQVASISRRRQQTTLEPFGPCSCVSLSVGRWLCAFGPL